MNEVPLGSDWPRPKARLKRMIEAAQIIRKLWYPAAEEDHNNTSKSNKGFVYFNGEYFLIRNARLYSPPTTHIPIFMAAAGPESAKAAAKYSDGLITFLSARESHKIIGIFDKALIKKNNGKKRINNSNIDSIEKIAEYKVSYSNDYEQALRSSRFWRATLIDNAFNSSISDPRKLEQNAKEQVTDKKLKEHIEITDSIENCIKSIEEYFRVGFSKVYVHSTSPNEIKFIQEFGKRVLPYFQDS